MDNQLENLLRINLYNEDQLQGSETSLHSQKKQNPYEKAEFMSMISRQTVNRWYNKSALHREERIRILFGVLQKTAEMLELKIPTFCLTVHIFDSMISKFPISKEQMMPVGLVALQLASKINETQGKIITYKDLDQYVMSYGVEAYCKIEKTIVEQLNYQINLVSPNDILSFLMHKFIRPEHDFFGELRDKAGIKKEFMKFVFHLQLITFVDYEFYKFTSLAVAVSVIIFSRILLNLEPWPAFIAAFVGISQHNVKDCLEMIYLNYKGNFVHRVFKKIDFQNGVNHHGNQMNGSGLNLSSLVENSSQYFLGKGAINSYMSMNETADM